MSWSRRRWSCGGLCCVLALLAGPAPAQDDASQSIAKYAAPQVHVRSLMTGGGAVIVSSLHVLPNQDLLGIVFATREQAATLGVSARGKAVVIGRISKDQGRTWGPAFLVCDAPADGSRTAADSTIVVAVGKVLVIASMSGPPKPPFDYGDVKLWQVASVDNGVTWSKPTELAVPRTRPCVSGRVGVALGNGTLLVPYWWDFTYQIGTTDMAQISDTPCVAGTLRSGDGGATWEPSTDVFGAWSVRPKTPHTADEPAIVALSDKEIFMVLRSDRGDHFAEETWSHDGGRTWELPRPSKFFGFNKPAALWRLRSGPVVRLWDQARGLQRFPLVAAVSRDGCHTWSTPKTLVSFPEGSKWPVQASYPSVVETADGALVAVWCHVTPDGKWLWAEGRFAVDWLTTP